jgi:hypothetical protein
VADVGGQVGPYPGARFEAEIFFGGGKCEVHSGIEIVGCEQV